MEDFQSTSIGKGVAARAEVAKWAGLRPRQALAIARAIEHPWYRCQALTAVVQANPCDRDAPLLLQEAMEAAYRQVEPNRVASVARWPLQILVGTGAPSAVEHAKKLLAVIAQEPHGLRKLDGLQAILIAVMPCDALRALALVPFLQAARQSQGWRTERIIDVVVQVLAPVDREGALALLQSRPLSRYTKRSRGLLSNG